MQNPEYEIYKAVATYMKLAYPKTIFRFDQAGLNLSKTQSGKQKAISYKKGFPDFQILEARGEFKGFFIEIKVKSPFKADRSLKAGEHLKEQYEMLAELNYKGYSVDFLVGFDQCKVAIDAYMALK